MEHQREWASARDELVQEICALGFPRELGAEIARHLGSPRAIQRMTAYLRSARPDDVELVVDEMLAIKSEIDAWKEKKTNEEANAVYNGMLFQQRMPGAGEEE